MNEHERAKREAKDLAAKMRSKLEAETLRRNAAERSAARQQRHAARARRAIHRRCFWTRPIGHAWGAPDRYGLSRCILCGKPRSPMVAYDRESVEERSRKR